MCFFFLSNFSCIVHFAESFGMVEKDGCLKTLTGDGFDSAGILLEIFLNFILFLYAVRNKLDRQQACDI